MFQLFKLLSKIRRKRIFHPVGNLYQGSVRFEPAFARKVPDFKPDLPYDALVRVSRGIGLPPGLPDLPGLAIKIETPELTQDILLIKSGKGRLGKYLFLPSTQVLSGYYSSGLRYDMDGSKILLGAKASPHSVELLKASPFGSWKRIGVLTLGPLRPVEQSEHIKFNPWHTSVHLRPHGLLNKLRKKAYIGSQAGRPSK